MSKEGTLYKQRVKKRKGNSRMDERKSKDLETKRA